MKVINARVRDVAMEVMFLELELAQPDSTPSQ